TLPCSLNPKRDNQVSRKQANSNGPFKRARLISAPCVEQRRPPVSASIRTEDLGDADTSVYSRANGYSPSATRELISALDTAIMVAILPQAIELRQPAVAAHTLIEDIAQRSTLTLPAVTRDIEQEDQVDQKDITAT